jgi:pyruvate/2-oxoglutarate dehydrogenase complex dihydrolipoamide dehydrogenase (E3) component
VRTSVKADAYIVMGEAPDEVVVATGSEPLVPPVPGIDGPRVTLYTDVLRGTFPTGENVVVGGGGLVGCETALYLAEKGNSVTIIEMLPDIALGMEPISRSYLVRELASHNVAVFRNARIEKLSDTSVHIRTQDGLEEVPFQHFIAAFGGKPRDFGTLPVRTHVVGDAIRIGKLVEAVRDGYAAGVTL